MHTRVDVLIVRLLRVSVFALIFAVPLARDVLERLSDGHRILATSAMWALWAIVLLSVLVPASTSLTALRLAAPAHLATIVIVVGVGGIDVGTAIALASSAVVTVLSSSGETGAYFIQSSAYGDERRFPLRCPRPFLAVIVLAWFVWFTTAAIGAVLVIAGAILGVVIGVILLVVALVGFVVLPRRFHRYSRRWLVRVPAGLVVHDHVLLTETAMFPHRVVTAIDTWTGHTRSRATDSDDEPFDLSGGLDSHGVVIRLSDPETVILAPTKDHPGGRAFHVRAARVCPTRIGRTITALTS